MSIALAAATCGPAAQENMNALNTGAVLQTASSIVTARCASSIRGQSALQLTLALTTGHHVGPLFIVQKRRAPVIHGGTLGGKRRRRREARATPHWLTVEQKTEIRLIYAWADAMTAMTGEQHVVDHIVPLDGKIVCGLHVSWNMRVTHWLENCRKGWGVWPDMPFDQLDLFENAEMLV